MAERISAASDTVNGDTAGFTELVASLGGDYRRRGWNYSPAHTILTGVRSAWV